MGRLSQGVSSVDVQPHPTCVSAFSSLLWLSVGQELRTRPKASKAGQPLTRRLPLLLTPLSTPNSRKLLSPFSSPQASAEGGGLFRH